MEIHLGFWLLFVVLFILIFTIDMIVTDHRKGPVKVRTALTWTTVWIATALCFAALMYFYFPEGNRKAFEFLTGYIVEYSLSVDNLFVFILIFSIMNIEEKNQPRILKWGILGAVFFRVVFIVAGVELIHKFHFMIYVFGAVLIYTAYKMITSKDEKVEPEHNVLVKLASKMFNIKSNVGTDHFFIVENHKLFATIAFITLVLIESTDIIFAVDSIPAVLAITQNSFTAITSNLFAILGLRSLFFALAGILNLFRFLKYGISFILLFIGIKMLISGWYVIPIEASLLLIVAILVFSIVISIMIKEKIVEEIKDEIQHPHKMD